MNFDRAQEYFYQEVRRFAVLLLTTRAHQALDKSSRTPGDSAQAEGGQLTGWPPAPAGPAVAESVSARDPRPADSRDSRYELHLLASLLLKDASHAATPAETREIAELWEFLDCEEEAFSWWVKAADLGDEDAQSYLEILLEENEQDERSRVVPLRAAKKLRRVDLCALSDDVIVQVDPVCAWPGTPGRPRSPLPEVTRVRGADTNMAVERMVREIEVFLAHPDQMTDGRTR